MTDAPRQRIAVVGIGSESSGFAPHRTRAEDFTLWRGDAVLTGRHPFLSGGSLGVVPSVQFVGGLVARALPGGPVTMEAYEGFVEEIVRFLAEAGPFDGVLLDLHGATIVDGMDDAEGDLAERVRATVGAEALVAASMDQHGQVSERFARLVDLPTCYRTAPHVDWLETRERADRLLARCLADGVRPVRAWVRIPVALPGEKTSTRDEPARSIYASLADDRRPESVLDTALWVGYAWADEPRTAAAVVCTGTDEQAVTAEALRVAHAWFDARDMFTFCAPHGDAAWAVDKALAATGRPFLVSDSGDNPTAGGSGDVVAMLRQLLATPAFTSGQRTAIWSALVDPAGVAAATEAGLGGAFSEVVGGCFGWPDSLRLDGVVECLSADDEGVTATIRVGGLMVVLTNRRRPFHTMDDYRRVGLEPLAVDVIVDKIGYLETDLHAHAAGWVLALTDGPVDQRIERLHFERIGNPMHPFTEVPDDLLLEAVVFRSASVTDVRN